MDGTLPIKRGADVAGGVVRGMAVVAHDAASDPVLIAANATPGAERHLAPIRKEAPEKLKNSAHRTPQGGCKAQKPRSE